LVNYDRVEVLEFQSDGSMGVYLDDISLNVSVPIPIGPYDMTGDEFGEKTLTGHEPEISVKPTPETPPDKRVESPDLRPSMKGKTGPVPFPKPINL
jgi:hypothetical protein